MSLNGEAETLKIFVMPGIGDFSWIYSKLSTLKVPLDVEMCKDGPDRGMAFLDMLPWVKKAYYAPRMAGEVIDTAWPWHSTKEELVSAATEIRIAIQANTHLEQGQRLETWLSDIDTDYHYELDVGADRIKEADDAWPGAEKYLVIFPSGYEQTTAWSGWQEAEWLLFLQMFRKEVADWPIVLIGAPWDKSLADAIETKALADGFTFHNLAGKLHLASTTHIIREAGYFVSYPAGLAMIANVVRTPTMMFYPKHLERMIGTWCDPADGEAGRFREMLFCRPEETICWLKQRWSEVSKQPKHPKLSACSVC